MCLVLAVVLAIFAFNAMMAGELASGTMAILGALFFAALMIRNVRYVRGLRRDDESER